jgi:hypothetical protein
LVSIYLTAVDRKEQKIEQQTNVCSVDKDLDQFFYPRRALEHRVPLKKFFV